MKMIRVKKILLIFILIMLLFLSSCSFGTNDETFIKEEFTILLKHVNEKNNLEIKGMFSENVRNSSLLLDENISELVSYYDGTYSKIEENGGSYTEESFDHGKISKTIRMGFKVYSTIDNYYFCFDWCIEDDFDEKNIGIKSMYTIKESENRNPNTSYGGDGSFTNGLFIGMNHMNYYIDDLSSYLLNKDNYSIKQLFSCNVILSNDNLDFQISNLISKFDTIDKINRKNSIIIYKTSEDQKTIQYYELFWTLSIGENNCNMAAKVVLTDLDNEKNVGLTSLYMRFSTLNDIIDDTNWTDGLWASGINYVV